LCVTIGESRHAQIMRTAAENVTRTLRVAREADALPNRTRGVRRDVLL
jgi:hypothetical protein